jgi:hypothetical protein
VVAALGMNLLPAPLIAEPITFRYNVQIESRCNLDGCILRSKVYFRLR